MILKEEVQKIARLARLELTDEEMKKMQKELSEILDYFEILKKADLSNVSPVVRTTGLENNVVREDEVVAADPKLAGKLVKMAPGKEGKNIKVKAIL